MAKLKAFLPGGRKDVDMTEGSITRHLIHFALPLLVGNIFQQLYNTVDAWVVGNFVSNEAFSAVGTVGPILNMLIGFFLGLSGGAGVVISQYYGAKRYDKVSSTVHTAMVMTLVLAAIFTVAGILLIPVMLDFMKTPAEVLPESTAYLTICFGGISGLMIYNMGAGILRAVGDSRHPFYYLVTAALVNTALDLLFVIVFDMGVAGVAWATVIAQAVSAVLALRRLWRDSSAVKLRFRALKVDFLVLRKIIRVGIPSAIQMAVTSFSNVFVQSYINVFGADCMSGWTAFSKLDQLIILPMQTLGMAATTFVGQNLGVRKVERARKGANTALAMAVGTTVLIAIPVVIFAPQLTAFFNSKAEVVRYGTLFLRWLSPFFVLSCVNQIYAGALQGAGSSRASMIIMLGSFVVFRQIYLYVMANYIVNAILPIALGYPAGWLLCSISIYTYYRRTDLTKNVVVTEA